MSSQPLAATKRGDEERQLTLSYAGGPLAPAQPGLSKAGLQAGDRAPDAQYVDAHCRTRRVHEAFQGPHFTLLALGAGAADAAAAVEWPAAGAALERLVVPDPRPGLTRIYGVTGTALVLVRPDGYIAAIDRDGQHTAIKQFLALATCRRSRRSGSGRARAGWCGW